MVFDFICKITHYILYTAYSSTIFQYFNYLSFRHSLFWFGRARCGVAPDPSRLSAAQNLLFLGICDILCVKIGNYGNFSVTLRSFKKTTIF